MMVHTLELRPSSVYRKFCAGREGRVEREEEDGLGDLVRRRCWWPHGCPVSLTRRRLFCLPRSRRGLGRWRHNTLHPQINRHGPVHLVIVGHIEIKQAEF